MPQTAPKAAKTAKPAKAEKPAAPARAKAATARKPAPAEAPVAEPVPAAVVKLKALVDQVAAATGLKKPEAKSAVEATLAALSQALAANAALTVPPLGKLRVVKSVAGSMTLKLRQAGAAKAGGKALADDPQDE